MDNAWTEVRGLVGDDGAGVLVSHRSPCSGWSYYHGIVGAADYAVAGGRLAETRDQPLLSGQESRRAEERTLTTAGGDPHFDVLCNRKWIVGLANSLEMVVWKVSGCGLKVSEEQSFQVDDVIVTLQFSPVSVDVVLSFSENAQQRGFVEFIDLESSFSGKTLVVTSRVECSYHRPKSVGSKSRPKFFTSQYTSPKGILWMPDGSASTLHGSPGLGIALESTTGNEANIFPPNMDVIPVATRHVLTMSSTVCNEFHVYSTNNLKTPSLCVQCTWASAHVPSGLIASTSDGTERGKNTSEIHFTVHDGATGFCVGDFTFSSIDPFVIGSVF